jgi:hypothetical protein
MGHSPGSSPTHELCLVNNSTVQLFYHLDNPYRTVLGTSTLGATPYLLLLLIFGEAMMPKSNNVPVLPSIVGSLCPSSVTQHLEFYWTVIEEKDISIRFRYYIVWLAAGLLRSVRIENRRS